MMESYINLKNKVVQKGLKVTPQRVAVLEAVLKLNHPSVDQILDYIQQNFPGISTGTVYNILAIFAKNGLVQRVKTDKGIMRYDAITEKHHHLYCIECDLIKDYYDEELSSFLENYFANKKIENFLIDDIKLQIVGRFHK